MTRHVRYPVLWIAMPLAFSGCGGAAGAPQGTSVITPSSDAGAPLAGEQRRFVAGTPIAEQYLVVGSNAAVNIDSLPDATPVRTITQGISGADALTMDGKSDLFVENMNHTITEYAPPYTAPPAATMSIPGNQPPFALSSDPQGDLVAGTTTSQFEIFEPPYSGAPITFTIPAGQLDELTVDADRNVLVLATGGNLPGRVYEYSAPYTSAPTEPISNLPGGSVLGIDPLGNLWIAGVHFLSEYAPPYTGAPLVAFTESSSGTYLQNPTGITFTGKRDNVAVLNFVPINKEFEYVWTPPYTTPTGINRSVNVYYGLENAAGTPTDELWGVSERNHGTALGLVRWNGNFSGRPSIYDVGLMNDVGDYIPLLILGPVTL